MFLIEFIKLICDYPMLMVLIGIFVLLILMLIYVLDTMHL